jgi:hypothetical protein
VLRIVEAVRTFVEEKTAKVVSFGGWLLTDKGRSFSLM